ncbi:MAG: reductase anchor subunit [Symbiobacteriaceae bacterium]|jgi:anaerobic dimethyl sulfoxide reductase subunit C (anchor subunit)|nr:reductase anchor subunit [Symbiobacteriaceae bacterium]
MEWMALVLFTVLAEAAVGLMAVYGLYGLTAAAREQSSAYGKLGRTVYLTAGCTTLAAILISLEHLGWPLFAPRALMGLGSSPLSWEILLTGLFAAGAGALWWLSRSRPVAPWLTGICALVGVAATFISGRIYALPAIPANANAFPVVLFLVTALVTGAALLMLLLAVTEAGKALAPAWLSNLSLLTLGAVVLAAVATWTYTSAAAGGAPEAQAQAAHFTGSTLHLVRLVAGLLLPGAVLIWMARRPARHAVGAALLVAAVLLGGEIAGRYLFFESTTFLSFTAGL